jgi:hypothetical protein
MSPIMRLGTNVPRDYFVAFFSRSKSARRETFQPELTGSDAISVHPRDTRLLLLRCFARFPASVVAQQPVGAGNTIE